MTINLISLGGHQVERTFIKTINRILFIIMLCVDLSGCDLFETPEWHHKFNDVGKVDCFVIENGDRGVFVRFLVEGELSDCEAPMVVGFQLSETL